VKKFPSVGKLDNFAGDPSQETYVVEMANILVLF
jgi:hypothetical protein